MRRPVMWLVGSAVIVATGCAGPAGPAGPPGPAGPAGPPGGVAGYEVVTQETPVAPGSTKQLDVKCPGTKRALGAGWSVEDPTSAILDGTATHFQAAFDGSGFLVNAKSNAPFATDWKLRVRVICASVSP